MALLRLADIMAIRPRDVLSCMSRMLVAQAEACAAV
jgi:hypothetical protein